METRDRFSRGAYIFNYRRHLVDTLRMLCTRFHTSDTFLPHRPDPYGIWKQKRAEFSKSRESPRTVTFFLRTSARLKFWSHLASALSAERWAGG